MKRQAPLALPATETPDAYNATIDHASLSTKTYLRPDEAAAYLSYDKPRYANPVKAFLAVAERNSDRLRKFHFGRRLLFSRRDLDLFLAGRAKSVTPRRES
jgi:hypothetical protein